MKYPCETCLVDVICMEICNDLIFFSDDLTRSVPTISVNTERRKLRLQLCILKYGGPSERVVRLDNDLMSRWNTMKKIGES
jgi:hypothetical protein